MYFLFNTMISYAWSPALKSQKHGVPLLYCVLLILIDVFSVLLVLALTVGAVSMPGPRF